jgi:hypothetical protein
MTLRFLVPALQPQMVHEASMLLRKLASKLICSTLIFWTLASAQMMPKLEVTLKFGLSVRDVVFDPILRCTTQIMS